MEEMEEDGNNEDLTNENSKTNFDLGGLEKMRMKEKKKSKEIKKE